MLKQYQHVVGGLYRLLDALVIGVSWLVAYWLRFYTPLLQIKKGLPAFESYVTLLPLVLFLWAIVLSTSGIYRSNRLLRRTDEVFLILRAHAFALLCFIAITYLFTEFQYSRAVTLVFGVVGGVGIIGLRLITRNLLRTIRKKGVNLRYVLAVGEGPALESALARLKRFPEIGLRVAGALVHPDSQAKEIAHVPVWGHYSDLGRFIQGGHGPVRIDQLLISLPRSQSALLDEILRSIRDETLDIRLIPDVHEFVALGCQIEDFDGIPIVKLNESPLQGWWTSAKRLTDIVFAAIAILIFGIPMLVVSVVIKLTSPGPIFYRQERMGIDGRRFEMLKFRSMPLDAESATGAVWASANDRRRTPIGALLRRTSLDELPQLFNVLKGEMSLVGPRPERPVFVTQFRNQIPNYMLRHKVRAGMTGWAQINGWRGNTSLDRRIECDLYYVRNWSYLLDLKILVLTVWKGFLDRNAY